MAEELSRNGLVPEMVIVAIANTNSLRDLTPPGISVSGSSLNEGGDKFLDFIEKELLPEVTRQLRGGPPYTFIGHSSGGILVTYARGDARAVPERHRARCPNAPRPELAGEEADRQGEQCEGAAALCVA